MSEKTEQAIYDLIDVVLDCEQLAKDGRYELAERRAWKSVAVKLRAIIKRLEK